MIDVDEFELSSLNDETTKIIKLEVGKIMTINCFGSVDNSIIINNLVFCSDSVILVKRNPFGLNTLVVATEITLPSSGEIKFMIINPNDKDKEIVNQLISFIKASKITCNCAKNAYDDKYKENWNSIEIYYYNNEIKIKALKVRTVAGKTIVFNDVTGGSIDSLACSAWSVNDDVLTQKLTFDIQKATSEVLDISALQQDKIDIEIRGAAGESLKMKMNGVIFQKLNSLTINLPIQP